MQLERYTAEKLIKEVTQGVKSLFLINSLRTVKNKNLTLGYTQWRRSLIMLT